ncbi:MAG: hypothetical protein PHF86_12930 [Candidatus Nanoarchaeia archaeon]|jgi:hypothetical protein|nr:hypothetical protein [Candidatus Nanoarchaeia archaeon]
MNLIKADEAKVGHIHFVAQKIIIQLRSHIKNALVDRIKFDGLSYTNYYTLVDKFSDIDIKPLFNEDYLNEFLCS